MALMYHYVVRRRGHVQTWPVLAISKFAAIAHVATRNPTIPVSQLYAGRPTIYDEPRAA